MSLETDFYALLAAEATLQPLLGTRIFPDKMPQNLNAPAAGIGDYVAIVYQRISSVPEVTHEGGDSFTVVRLQVACYARTHEALRIMAAAVRALNGSSQGAIQNLFIADERGGFDPDAAFYRRDIDFEVEINE